MTSRIIQPTRRLVIAAGAAAVAVGLTSPAAPADLAAASRRDLADLMTTVERLLIDRYDAMLRRFDATAFTAAGLPKDTRKSLQTIVEQERSHLATIGAWGESILPLNPTHSDPTELPAALSQAAMLESFATAVYAGVLPVLDNRRLIEQVSGIHSVEARHAAWLASIVGDDPFPNAIDQALAPEDALAQLIGSLQAPAAGSPAAGTPVASTPGLAPVLAAIAADQHVSETAVQVMAFEPRTWPDSSLGCPQPGQVYLDVLTPGYLALVEIDGQRFEYHADERGNLVRCS
jgi:hypothetical protein